MLISLSEIVNAKDKTEHIRVPIEMESFDFLGSSYEFADKEMVDLTITNLGNRMVLINGSTSISLFMFCSRCLKKLVFPYDISFQKEIDFKLTDAERTENLDEANYIVGYNLDVDILIREEIVMGFPMKLLCRPDCKGICKTCGTDLNEKDCNCDNTEYDPRMSVIRDIFNNFKEV